MNQVYQAIEDSYDLIKDRKSDMPYSNYDVETSDATEIDFNPTDYIQGIITKTFPKWQFKVTEEVFYSTKPIEIAITREDGIYYAENESLEIYATGSSEQEAIEDFVQHVIYFYNHFKGLDWDKVIGRARKLKEIYENLFQEQA